MLLQIAVPPSFPADVRVFSGSESATVSWSRPSFVQSFFGKYFGKYFIFLILLGSCLLAIILSLSIVCIICILIVKT